MRFSVDVFKAASTMTYTRKVLPREVYTQQTPIKVTRNVKCII